MAARAEPGGAFGHPKASGLPSQSGLPVRAASANRECQRWGANGSKLSHMERREFLTTLAALQVAAKLDGQTSNGMIYRNLGTTGQRVSALGLGGYHIGVPKEEREGIRIVRSAIDRGITFLDNSCDYHDGGSEIRMGKALKDGYRKRVFLMTKYNGRTREMAAKQIDESLRRLQVETIDLIQFHENIRMEDPDRFFAEGGALEAVMAAKKAGKVRYIGSLGIKTRPCICECWTWRRKTSSISIRARCR
jgi:hypothetical protein